VEQQDHRVLMKKTQEPNEFETQQSKKSGKKDVKRPTVCSEIDENVELRRKERTARELMKKRLEYKSKLKNENNK